MRRRIHTTLLPALAIGWLLMLGACATYHVNQKLPIVYDGRDGYKPKAFKRIEAMPERNFFNHFFRTAYLRSPEHPHGAPDPAFTTIIEELGNPDWIRKTFTSLEGERVDEWVYLNEGRVFQFIGSDMVYDGPLTDYEQTLLRRGYPDNAITIQQETGSRVDILTYHSVFGVKMEMFKFENGMIIHSKEGI